MAEWRIRGAECDAPNPRFQKMIFTLASFLFSPQLAPPVLEIHTEVLPEYQTLYEDCWSLESIPMGEVCDRICVNSEAVIILGAPCSANLWYR